MCEGGREGYNRYGGNNEERGEKIKCLLLSVLLSCQGCTVIQYNYCNEGIPPENSDADIKRLFQGCSSPTGVIYYVAFAEGQNAELQARRFVTEKKRRVITGKRRISIPLYDLELFKHFRYGDYLHKKNYKR